MKHSARLVLLTLGLGLFAVLLSSFPSHPATAAVDPPTLPVKVTNTPLPVQGSVNAAVTGNVNATIVGAPGVNILSAPPVNFPSSFGVTGTVTVSNPLNTSAQPTPLVTRQDQDLVDEPFATSICTGIGGASGLGIPVTCASVASSVGLSSAPPASFIVPSLDSAGNTVKELVINFVSGNCNGGASPIALISTISLNPIGAITQATNFLNTSPSGIVSQTANIVAGPGTSVGMSGGNTGFAPCFLTVNGYLAH